MSRETTGYAAVSANIPSAPTDTEGYQPAASSSYPLQSLGQTTSQSVTLAYDSSKLLNYQVYCRYALVILSGYATSYITTSCQNDGREYAQ